MNAPLLKAPFPWFGGKSRVADLVWERFGDTLNYVEPFAGSLAVLLYRPFPTRTETVNDRDTYLANFWRAVRADPEAVAHYADHPVNEADLHSRHLWLVQQEDFRERMMTEPDFFDAKIAGWWVWGQSAWIGSGWCDVSQYERNKNKRPNLPQGGGRGVNADSMTKRQRPELKADRGVHTVNGRSRPNLRPAQGVHGLSQQIPHLNGDSGAAGSGIHASAFNRKTGGIYAYMNALQERMRRIRVTCGDWKRICGPSVTYKIGMTAVFLDPPYGDTRADGLYAVDSLTVADEVRVWCLEEIDDGAFKGPRYQHPKLRIALCGLDGEHNELEELGWDAVAWKTNGGYGNQKAGGNNGNNGRERIWFSPNCLKAERPEQLNLFGGNHEQ